MRPALRQIFFGGGGRPANNLFALCGDSRPHADHNGSSSSQVVHNQTGIGYWTQVLTSGLARFPYSEDYAVGGSTTEDLVSSQLASVIASPAASVVLLSSTNDQAADWAASRSIAALETAISAILAAGKFLYLIAELPRGSSGFTGVRFTAQEQTDHDIVRAYLLGRRHPRLTVIDAYPVVADIGGTPTDYIATQTYDGIHPSAYGAYSIASVLAPYVITRHTPGDGYGWNSSDTYNSSTNPKGNQVVNGQMAGTAGTLTTSVTGSLATSWTTTTQSFTGLAAVCSKVTTATGDWQQIVLSGSSGTGTPQVNFKQNLTYANFSTGDNIDGRGEFEVDASSVGFLGMSYTIQTLNTGVTKRYSVSGNRASGPGNASAITGGRWRLPALVNIAGDENTIQAVVSLLIAASTNNIAATVRFRNLDARKA